MAENLCDKCVADCKHEIELGEIVVMCGSFKERKTNADRIRSMSDDKLAKFLDNWLGWTSPGEEEIINWLRQIAEED